MKRLYTYGNGRTWLLSDEAQIRAADLQLKWFAERLMRECSEPRRLEAERAYTEQLHHEHMARLGVTDDSTRAPSEPPPVQFTKPRPDDNLAEAQLL
jgi:hypothetical protein